MQAFSKTAGVTYDPAVDFYTELSYSMVWHRLSSATTEVWPCPMTWETLNSSFSRQVFRLTKPKGSEIGLKKQSASATTADMNSYSDATSSRKCSETQSASANS